jgi:alpha-ketoglutarate-dependent taurine dioxygenase
MDIKKLGPIGAEITNVNLKDISQNEFSFIKDSFLDNSVLVFKKQNLNPEELKSISNLWGKPLIHPV